MKRWNHFQREPHLKSEVFLLTLKKIQKMKYLLITISLLSLLSCGNKTLTEDDIQKILDSSKIYNEYTLKKDFKI